MTSHDLFRLDNYTRSSAVAKRPRDASCLSVVSFVASNSRPIYILLKYSLLAPM